MYCVTGKERPMTDLKEMLKNGPVILDGATGTNLQKMGMPMDVCPEQWIIRNRPQVQALERAYVDAGSQIIYAPTFAASRIKLKEYGLEDQVVPMNRALVEMALEAAGGRCFVAGNLTMTGQMLRPLGTLPFEELVDCYKEQARAIADAGADLFVIETMMHIGEARAALLAVKEVCDLPVIVTMTVESSGKTMYGTDAVTALVTLQSMGADAVGLNCSTGPDRLLPLVEQMKPYAAVPLVVKPNAGLPKLITGETVFDMGKEDFARHMKALVEAGASIIGGCCGSTPDYIRLLAQTVRGMNAYIPEKKSVRVLTGEHCMAEFSLDGPFEIIGERINPTGKKWLREALKAGDFECVQEMAVSQVSEGARVLDINVGMSGIDEKEMMLRVIDEVNEAVDVPLCIDSSNIEVVEAALRHYHGRALVNSVSCERVKLERLLPIVKKYGAMFIMLPLNDEGLPESFQERKDNLDKIMEEAFRLGFTKEDMVADGLVATLGANSAAGLDTLKTIEYCHDTLGIATVCGLSNISFGLPDRSYVNSIFLALAISRGLTMAIANPSQELLMRSAFAADLVMDKSGAALRYIENAAMYKQRQASGSMTAAAQMPGNAAAAAHSGTDAGLARPAAAQTPGSTAAAVHDGTDAGLAQPAAAQTPGSAAATAAHRGMEAGLAQPAAAQVPGSAAAAVHDGTDAAPFKAAPGFRTIYEDVLKGKKKQIVAHIQEALEGGAAPKTLLDAVLIPAINQVGDYFNDKIYFLPQLMMSAETMRTGIDYLEPMLSLDAQQIGYTVVIATVEGDIHDIGKNLVAMMMKNYGFCVIDLGKDVPAKTIVETAISRKADVIALSALMTTTMQKMRDVVALAREMAPGVRVIIGGAVITQEYADEIGADGYSEDAVGAVALVKRLMEKP